MYYTHQKVTQSVQKIGNTIALTKYHGIRGLTAHGRVRVVLLGFHLQQVSVDVVSGILGVQRLLVLLYVFLQQKKQENED